MKTSKWSAAKISFLFTGISLVGATVGAGCAGAETYRYGGSTATIEQSGGNGVASSRVTRYRDGQKVVTRDGNSTDITIQRSGDSVPSDTRWGYTDSSNRRFDNRSIEERFSRIEF